MLKYNVKNLMKVRGITHPYAFLRKRGFSHSTAARMAGEKMVGITPSLIESLCLVLKCTPNDLFVWTPGNGEVVSEGHPLKKLIAKESVSLDDLGNDIAVDRIVDFIKEAKALEEKYRTKE